MNIEDRIAEIRDWNRRLGPILRADTELSITRIGMTRTQRSPADEPDDQYQATVVAAGGDSWQKVRVGLASGPVVDHMIEAHNMIDWLAAALTECRRDLTAARAQIESQTVELHELRQPSTDTGLPTDGADVPLPAASVPTDTMASASGVAVDGRFTNGVPPSAAVSADPVVEIVNFLDQLHDPSVGVADDFADDPLGGPPGTSFGNIKAAEEATRR